MRTLKGLLLQMKLGTSEERILAEEAIVRMFEDEKARALKLVEALERISIHNFHGELIKEADVAESAVDAYHNASTDSGDGEKG